MSQKRFSRLSILLEARDRMTRPLQNATRASQQLQGAVQSLSGQQQRAANANDRVRTSVNGLRTSTARMSEAIKRAAKESALAHLTGKILGHTYTVLSQTIEGSSIAFARMKLAMSAVIRNSKVFKFTAAAVDQVKTSVQFLNNKILETVRNTYLWRKASGFILRTGRGIKTIASAIGSTAVKWKDATVNAVQNNKAVKAVKASILGVRLAVASTVIGFTLWKNSSMFVAKLKNDLNNVKLGIASIGKGIINLIPGLKHLSKNIQNAGRGLGQLGGRRATFNQLADSNARLNRELAKMNAQLSKGNSQLSRMKSSLGSIHGMGALFGAAYAGQAAYGAGERVVKGTVGKAMEQQYSSESVGILAGPENGAKYYEQIANYAASTTYSTEDWARNMRSAISKSKTTDELRKFQVVMEQLATLDPIQGLDGAALAVRELNSGDSVSLQERFELPKSALKTIRKITDPIKQIEALSEMIGKETGYTVKNIEKMKELPLMQWQKLTNSMKTAFGYMGAGALKVIAPLIEQFNEAWDDGKFKPIIKTMNDGLASFATKIIGFVKTAGARFATLKEKAKPFTTLLGNIRDTVVQGWPKVVEIFGNVRGVLGQVADHISSNWPTINTVIQKALDILVLISSEINDNWPAIKEVIIGVGAAFLAFKILTPIGLAFKALTTAIALWRSGTLLATAAQWAMNTALWANPIGLVIGAIAALIGYFVMLARNIGWATEKFDSLGKWKYVVAAVLGPIGLITASVIELNRWLGLSKDGGVEAFGKIKDAISQAWEMFKTFIDTVKNAQFDWKAILPGGESFINFGEGKGKFGTGHHGGLNRVPYNGYEARLHKGEKVLTAQEAKNSDSKVAPLITGNNFIVREEADIDKIAQSLFDKLYSAQTAMGK